MKIDVLICTIDEGILSVWKILLPPRPNVSYVVSHQYTDKQFAITPGEIKRSDVIVSHIPGKGVSRNRNNAVSLAKGDIAILADDDVSILEDCFDVISKTYASHPEVDVACFKIKTLPGEKGYKNYPSETYSMSKGRKHYVSTIEVTFRVNKIRSKAILFDRRFGLGSRFVPFGEEPIFIDDCVKAGLEVRFYPSYIVQHPFFRSTWKIPRFDRVRNIHTGAADARKRGLVAILLAFLHIPRHINSLIESRKCPLAYLAERLFGAFYIILTNIKKPCK